MPKPALWLIVCAAAWGGCTGEIASDLGPARPSLTRDDAPVAPTAGQPSGAHDAGTSGPDAAAVSCNAEQPQPGPAPLNRLTRTQYLNTVRDLFGEVPELATTLGSASEASELGLVQPDVAPVELENYQAAAELIARTTVSTPDKLKAVAPCAAGRECARSLLRDFGTRLYRSPITETDDLERHLAVYDLGAQTSHEHGIELLLQAMLQAPRFLYRVELGTERAVGDHAVALSGYELATRLSYAFWDSAPDAELIAAAASGKLASPDGRKATLETMLAQPRGSVALRRFLERWLRLAQLDQVVKDEALYPTWNEGLRAALRSQAEEFLDRTLAADGGKLETLLTSQTVYVNETLAGYYPGQTVSGAALQARNDSSAAGVLTLPAWLAIMAKPGESSPIYRGKFVREALLCQQLPAPPANIPKPPEVTAGVSTRERLAQHETDPACSGCHRLMDPIGFGFERYDAIGRARTQDAGKQVDDHGELVAAREGAGTFSGVRELATRLAASSEVQECLTRQWFRFALGRFERPVDNCSVAQLTAAFEDSGANLHTLPSALLESPAFLYRQPPETP